MKARIIYDYPIYTSLQPKAPHMNEIVTIIGQSDGALTLNTGGLAFCCMFDDGAIANIQDTWLQIIELEPTTIPDWEQRRYEIAKDIYAANEMVNAVGAVACADELIAELKKQTK